MNTTALDFALKLLTNLPALIQAGVEVTQIVTRSREQITAMQAEDRGPTDAEWDQLNAEIDRLRGELHAG